MPSPTRPLFAVLAAAVAFPVAIDAGESEHRDTFEGIYKRWRTAIIEKDSKAWLDVTASYSKRVIRNTIVSQKLRYPEALFDAPMRPPALEGLKFLGAHAVGRTGQAVYYGKVSFSILEESPDVPENLLVLRFMKDGDHWKFDTTRMVALSSLPEIARDIKKGDYSFLEEEAFSPPGTVPPLPKECPRPERIAHLQVVSIGYRTEVTINGHARHAVTDTAASELILGGMRAGMNEVRIRTRPTPRIAGQEAPEKHFEVTIVTVDDHAEKTPVKVFHLKPDEAPPSYKANVRGLPN